MSHVLFKINFEWILLICNLLNLILWTVLTVKNLISPFYENWKEWIWFSMNLYSIWRIMNYTQPNSTQDTYVVVVYCVSVAHRFQFSTKSQEWDKLGSQEYYNMIPKWN